VRIGINKINRTSVFGQSDWLKKYFNAKQRFIKIISDFEKSFLNNYFKDLFFNTLLGASFASSSSNRKLIYKILRRNTY